MDEPRLQKIGFEIAKLIHEIGYTNLSVTASGTKEHIIHQIAQTLAPRRDEILKLRTELLPKALRDFLGEEDQWSLTLHPDNIQIMETIGDGWKNLMDGQHEHFQKEIQKNARAMALDDHLLDTPRNFGIYGGVLEEGRLLLGMMEIHARSLNHYLEMPQLAVSMDDHGFNADHVSCDLNDGRPALWFFKAILCPLKFGIHGIETLRAASDILKVIPAAKKEMTTAS